MILIGMLDSPYVRRVAVSLRLLGLPFEHRALSVFRDFEAFRDINPLVKVPTLITDDGTILVESTLILEFARELAPATSALEPADVTRRLHHRSLVGAGLVAMEKAVSLYYESNLRPERLRHPGWIERHRLQLRAACDILERAAGATQGWLFGERPTQADITSAVAWTFVTQRAAEDMPAAACPALTAFTQRAENDEALRAYPFPRD